LLRFPGVFTALADVLAGYLLVRFSGAGEGEPRHLPFLLGASACLYLGGMAWNDVFDFEQDKENRPDRPLPSGMISLTGGFLIAAFLSVAGVMLAMTAGFQPFAVAMAILCAVLLYNSGGKQIEIVGPLAMGSCRGLNLILGMTAHRNAFLMLTNPSLCVPVVMLLAYTAVVTVLSQMETPQKEFEEMDELERLDEPQSDLPTELEEEPLLIRPAIHGDGKLVAELSTVQRAVSVLGGAGLLLFPVAGALLLPLNAVSGFFFAVLALLLAVKIIRAWATPLAENIGRLVGVSLLGIVLLDAGMVAALAAGDRLWPLPPFDSVQLAAVGLVAALIIPAYLLKKKIAIT
jgi:hypothetical protein